MGSPFAWPVAVAAVCLIPALAAAKCPPDSVEVGPTCVDKRTHAPRRAGARVDTRIGAQFS